MIAKILKFTGITILVLILSLLIFVNTTLFDRFLASQIKEKVLFATGLELNFSRFYVSLFKGKLEAEGISLSNAIKVKKIDLDISSLRLLFAKLDIERARVYGVDINIDRDFKIKSFSKNPKELDSKGFDSVIVRDFRLEDVNVHFSDKKGNVASFVSKDFFIQAGYNSREGNYSGVIQFSNGQVVYNNNPYLLNVACYFEFSENAIVIKQLSITTGGLKFKSKGRFAKNKSEISIEGEADLFELTKVKELKGVKAEFNLKGDLKILKGEIRLSDGKRVANGILTIDIEGKRVSIDGLSGNFKEHLIKIDGSVNFKNKLKVSLTSSIKGKYLKDFHIDLDIVKGKEWNYNAHLYGIDCGNGVCGVRVISGKTPKLSSIKLNLPILKTDIENNTGWIELGLSNAKLFVHGDFFKNNILFKGLITIKKLVLSGIDFPQLDANVEVKSKDLVNVSSMLVKSDRGTARLSGEWRDNNLDFKAVLNNFPFKKALFFLDKETLNEVEIYGDVDGKVEIKGKYDNPSVKGSLTLLHPNFYGLYFSSINSDFVYSDFKLNLANTIASSGGGFLKGYGFINFDNEDIKIFLKGKGVELNYLPLEELYAEDSNGSVSIDGTLSNLKINSHFDIGNVAFSDVSFGEGSLDVKMLNNDIFIGFALKNGLSGKGVVKGGKDLNFEFKADRFVYQDQSNKINLNGDFTLKGDVENPELLSGKGEISSISVSNPVFPQLKARDISLNLKGMELEIKNATFLEPASNFRASFDNLKIDLNKDELASDVSFEGNGSMINSLLKKNNVEGIEFKGNFNGKFKVFGVIYSPFYSGGINANGNVYLKDAGYLIKDANFNVLLDYDLIKIRDFSGNIKDGSFHCKGRVIGKSIDIQAKLQNIPIDVPGFYADANGLVFFRSKSEDTFELSGYVELKNGILNVEQMLSGESEESFLDKVELNLKTSLEGVSYSDKDISLLFGKSNLKLTGSATNPILQGVQFISKESYLNIGDNRFHVNKGKLVFNNPLENTPYVDIMASAELNNYRIMVLLKGDASKINIKFLSDPPLSQNKILSVLFGGGINTGIYDFYHGEESENLSGVGAALALNSLLASFNSKMRKTLKVDRFSVSSQVFDVNRSPSPVMSFEKSLSSRLSFLFAQSLDTGGNLMELTYHMAGRRNVYIRNEIDGSITVEFEILK